jgi:hypothetical protein
MAAKGLPMVRISVMYVGQPADPAAFDAYYWELKRQIFEVRSYRP